MNRLLAGGTFAALIALKHRRHLVTHTFSCTLAAPDHAESAYHSKRAYRQGDVRVHSSVLCFSEKHLFSPFFVVFLFFHAFIFLFVRLTKADACCKIYIRNILWTVKQ